MSITTTQDSSTSYITIETSSSETSFTDLQEELADIQDSSYIDCSVIEICDSYLVMKMQYENYDDALDLIGSLARFLLINGVNEFSFCYRGEEFDSYE